VSLALARGHQPDLLFTILISHRLGTTESLKQHCLLSGGEVPGWFLYGSANTQNHACAKTTLPAERRRGSWMVPGWFRQQIKPRMCKNSIACWAAA
jgi:hypothetical protein